MAQVGTYKGIEFKKTKRGIIVRGKAYRTLEEATAAIK